MAIDWKKEWAKTGFMLHGEKSKLVEEPKEIKETKCTCSACGNTWFFGKSEQNEQKMNKLHNAGKAMACCGGCLPALLIKEKDVRDLSKCPKCGSKAVKKEEVIHHV